MSAMQKCDLMRRFENLPAKNYEPSNIAQRVRLENDVAAFLSGGGAIQVLPSGATSEFANNPQNFVVNPKYGDTLLTRNRRSAKRAQTTVRQSSVVGPTAAAKRLEMSLREFDRMCAAGNGPKQEPARGNTRRYHINTLDVLKRRIKHSVAP